MQFYTGTTPVSTPQLVFPSCRRHPARRPARRQLNGPSVPPQKPLTLQRGRQTEDLSACLPDCPPARRQTDEQIDATPASSAASARSCTSIFRAVFSLCFYHNPSIHRYSLSQSFTHQSVSQPTAERLRGTVGRPATLSSSKDTSYRLVSLFA